MSKIVGLMLLGLLAGCEDAEPARIAPETSTTSESELAVLSDLPALLDSKYAWRFRPLREIQTMTDEVDDPLVYYPQSLLELSNGTLLVHDPQAEEVLAILDPAGPSVRRRFGRAGPGPEEFGSRLSFVENSEGFSVLDSRNRQLHRFGLDGRRISAEALPFDGSPGKAVGSTDGSFLVEVLKGSETGWHREIIRLDSSTGESDFVTRLPPPPPGSEVGRIQRGRVLWTVSGERLAAMWSARPEIHVYDLTGTLIRTIQLPLTRRSLSERDIQRQVAEHGEFVLGRLQPGPAALTNELYFLPEDRFGMLTSDLWKAAEDPTLPVGRIWWRIFSMRGEYLGAVPLPEDFWPLGPSENGVWARVLDEVGHPVIQKLDLVRDPSG